MKKINIPTDENKFYRAFLEVLRSIPPISKLRPKELDVLAEIMLQNAKYKDMDEETRGIIIFDTTTRRKMRDKIGIGEESFNNNLSILRKHKLLTKDNKITDRLRDVLFDGEYSLEFNFKKR